MTTFAAYDAGLPCRNPNCKSHGQPHPNCKCYVGLPESESHGATPGTLMMADGGAVQSGGCSSNDPHQPGCEYFADGGSVDPADIDSLVQGQDHTPQDAGHSVGASLANMGAMGLFKGKGDDINTFNKHVRQGTTKINKSVEGLFDGAHAKVAPDKEARDKLKDYISKGGVLQDIKAAQSGQDPDDKMVQPINQETALSVVHPASNMLMNTAKGRISNYLAGLQPMQNAPKLAYDDQPVNKNAERTYHRALDVANDPLSIVGHIGAGTLIPEHIKHIKAMFPEVDDHLQDRITAHITKNQVEGTKPNYRTRQGLSMYLGTNLDSTLTPAMMQAAQATFAPQQQAAMPQSGAKSGGAKGSKKALDKVGDEYKTQSDAAATRAQQ